MPQNMAQAGDAPMALAGDGIVALARHVSVTMAWAGVEMRHWLWMLLQQSTSWRWDGGRKDGMVALAWDGAETRAGDGVVTSSMAENGTVVDGIVGWLRIKPQGREEGSSPKIEILGSPADGTGCSGRLLVSCGGSKFVSLVQCSKPSLRVHRPLLLYPPLPLPPGYRWSR